jgi:hypothetical protein
MTSADRESSSETKHSVVDRAIAYRELEIKGGLRPAEIARREGRSDGYVSVHLFLGATLGSMPVAEQRLLRDKRLTVRVVQRLVSAARPGRDRTTATVQRGHEALRRALLNFLASPERRRRRRRGASGDDEWLFRFNHTACVADPLGYAKAHVEALTAAHWYIADRAVHALRELAVEKATLQISRPLRQLTPAQRGQLSDTMRAALPEGAFDAFRIFAEFTEALRTTRMAIERAAPSDVGHTPSPSPLKSVVSKPEVSAFDIEDDLSQVQVTSSHTRLRT